MTTTGGGAPFEAADGMLYYSRPVGGVGSLFAKPLAGGSEHPLGIAVTFWNYVPGAKGLYYMTPAIGSKPPYTFEIRVLDFTTKTSRTLYVLNLAEMSPGLSVSPDGKTVLIEGVAQITQDLMRIENFR